VHSTTIDLAQMQGSLKQKSRARKPERDPS
jgi:hypothetical protein